MSEVLIYLWGQNLVRKGKTARGEPVIYQNPDKWGGGQLVVGTMGMKHNGTTISD
jgi:hypothetical protein